MISFGEQRRFGEELAFAGREKHQGPPMAVVADHLDAAILDSEYPVGLVALTKQAFTGLKAAPSGSGGYFIWNPIKNAHGLHQGRDLESAAKAGLKRKT